MSDRAQELRSGEHDNPQGGRVAICCFCSIEDSRRGTTRRATLAGLFRQPALRQRGSLTTFQVSELGQPDPQVTAVIDRERTGTPPAL